MSQAETSDFGNSSTIVLLKNCGNWSRTRASSGPLAERGPYRQSLIDRAENPRRSLEWRVAQRTVYESTSRIIWLLFPPERPRYGE